MTNAERFLWILKLAAILGCGLMAGTFFAFSAFVMRALGRLPAPQGIAAMQSINVVVLGSWFMGAFMGTALACLVLCGWALFPWRGAASALLLAGALLYLAGTFGVTAACNVPLNDALASAKPESAEAARLWDSYLVSWTMWNHVRTAAALAATALMTLALWQRAPQ